MITLDLDTKEFDRALQLAVTYSDRTYPQVANGQGLALAKRAMTHTEKASADKIALFLGQIATQKKVSKKGKVSFKRIFQKEDSVAHRIVNALLRKQGKPMVWGDELNARARRMIGGRLKSAAFIKSGWIYVIRGLSRLVGYGDDREKGNPAGARMTGQAKGYVKPATSTLSGVVTCEIANTALIEHDGRNPMPVAQAGLQAGMDESARDILKHLEEKLGPKFKELSGGAS